MKATGFNRRAIEHVIDRSPRVDDAPELVDRRVEDDHAAILERCGTA